MKDDTHMSKQKFTQIERVIQLQEASVEYVFSNLRLTIHLYAIVTFNQYAAIKGNQHMSNKHAEQIFGGCYVKDFSRFDGDLSHTFSTSSHSCPQQRIHTRLVTDIIHQLRNSLQPIYQQFEVIRRSDF